MPKGTKLKDDTPSYETKFSKEIEFILADYISVEFLKEIAKTIEQRITPLGSKLEIDISTEMGANFKTTSWESVIQILKEAKKYSRVLGVISLKTGIFHKSSESNTHYSVDFRIQRLSNKNKGFLSVYAVAESKGDSKHVIDWSMGLIEDFSSLKMDENEVAIGNLIIDGNDGLVKVWTESDKLMYSDEPQKVLVVNPVETKPSKWSDKSNILTIISIVVAALLVVAGWIFFNGKSS